MVEGLRAALGVCPHLVPVEDGHEADDDARDGQDVEHGVEELVPDAAAAAASAVHEHGWKVIHVST